MIPWGFWPAIIRGFQNVGRRKRKRKMKTSKSFFLLPLRKIQISEGKLFERSRRN